MIYPTLGISIVVHAAVVAVGKLKNSSCRKERSAEEGQKNIKNKIFLALAIAAILEFVVFTVAGSSLALIYAGVSSDKSNYNIVKNAIYRVQEDNLFSGCTGNSYCIENFFSKMVYMVR